MSQHKEEEIEVYIEDDETEEEEEEEDDDEDGGNDTKEESIKTTDNPNVEENAENNDEEEPVPRKRRKPRTYTRSLGEWNIRETQLLCDLWLNERLLYDSRHPSHMNKPHRDRAVGRLVVGLAKQGVKMTSEQVAAKMSSLRAYFSGQISKTKRAKAKGQEYVSQWKFMDDLHFLEDAIVPRIKTPGGYPSSGERITRPPLRTSTGVGGSPRVMVNDISGKPKLSATGGLAPSLLSMDDNDGQTLNFATSNDDPENTIRYIMTSASNEVLDTSSPSSSGKMRSSSDSFKEANADVSFCNMILKILVKVPEGETKDMLKLKIHQDVLQAKYNTLNENGSQA